VVSVEVTEGHKDVACMKTLKSANLELRIYHEAPGRGFEEFACLPWVSEEAGSTLVKNLLRCPIRMENDSCRGGEACQLHWLRGVLGFSIETDMQIKLLLAEFGAPVSVSASLLP
jgi:hypothetical protein